jgi:hypothetical protein
MGRMVNEFVIGRVGRWAGPLGPRGWLVLFVPGVTLMAFGVLITIWPQLLVALIAGICLAAGALLAVAGWRLRPPSSRFGGSGFGGPYDR